jgi:hypothetical protein
MPIIFMEHTRFLCHHDCSRYRCVHFQAFRSMLQVLPSSPISLLIPCCSADRELLERIETWKSYPGIGETVVCCDGDPDGRGMNSSGVTVIPNSKPGRGGQQNCAASAATGSLFLFHHLDSDLKPEHTSALLEAMEDPAMTGGAFYRKFDERHPLLMPLENVERWHCRSWGALYGDQSLFARREIFETIGGFPDYPLMEDIEFSRRLRATGGMRLLDPPMRSSPRRHLQQGPWKTTFKNALLIALYHLGVNPEKLFKWYYPPSPSKQFEIKIKPQRQSRHEKGAGQILSLSLKSFILGLKLSSY